jgi:hypothetical protein
MADVPSHSPCTIKSATNALLFIPQSTLLFINKMKSTAILSLLVSVSMAMPTITNARGAIDAHHALMKRDMKSTSVVGTVTDVTTLTPNGGSRHETVRSGVITSNPSSPHASTGHITGVVKTITRANNHGYQWNKRVVDGKMEWNSLQSDGDRVTNTVNGKKTRTVRGHKIKKVLNGTSHHVKTESDGDLVTSDFNGKKKIVKDTVTGEKKVLMQGTVTKTTVDKETGATKIVTESRNDDLHPKNPNKY